MFNKKLIILFIFFFIFFSAPQLLRMYFYDDTLIGTTTYYHTRMAEIVSSGSNFDPLSFGGRTYTYPPGYHIFLSFIPNIIYFINPLLGAFGIMIAYYFGKQFKLSETSSLFSAAVLGLIPGYVYLSSHINPRLPALLLLMLSFLFVLRSKKEKKYTYLASLTMPAVMLIHPLVGGVGIFFLITLFRKDLKKIALPVFVSLLVFMTWFIPLTMEMGSPVPSSFYDVYVELKTGPQYFIFENGLVSDSVPLLVLLMASYAFFRLKENTFLREWALIALILPLLIGNRINEQLLFPIALLAGDVFIKHWKHMWEYFHATFIPVRTWKAIFVIYISLAGIISAGSLLMFPPTPQHYDAMLWLNENTDENSVIMANWFYGHWITSIAERKNVMDAYAEYAPNINERYLDSKKIIYGSDIEKTISLMKKYDISYIFYTKHDSIVYCSGFEYLTRTGYFEKEYETGDTYIYKINYNGNSIPNPIC